jgi:hypothetical protein
MEESIQEKNWFGRNWKWAIPTFGCLPIIIAIVLLFTAMVSKVTTMFKDSVPYTVAMENLQKNEFAIEILGEPIEPNGMLQGNINYENDLGTADLKIPVKGPKGEASLLVIAEKDGDTWTYQTMKVTFEESDEIIDLLPKLKE